MQTSPKRIRCRTCRASGKRPVVYGFPTQETFEKAERGEIVLGGCGIDLSDWDRERCPECGKAVRSPDRDSESENEAGG